MSVTLHQILKFEEGVEYEPYLDSREIWTIGCGWNVEQWGFPSFAAVELCRSGYISEESVERMLASKSQTAEVDADDFLRLDGNPIGDPDAQLRYPPHLNDARRRAVANMAFQLGRRRLWGFVETRRLIHAGDWEAAAVECLDSAWASADQTPERAVRVSNVLRSGDDAFYAELYRQKFPGNAAG